MKKLNLFIKYWKVGKLLHFVAAFALLVAFQSFIILQNFDSSVSELNWWIWLITFISFFNMGILAELDGFSRFQNYKQVKDQIYLNGFQERLLKPLSKSSCQRAAAILAGEELGIKDKINTYFFSKGYRWYHIVPDFVFNNPLFFFTPFFWRSTFFTPYYKPKINYEDLVFSGLNILNKG